mmetsp:Transcript_67856/g.207916  ORF Transcript_67856/g.207916 Transcript_67856/m.207916 type:complete len:218 (-) Transcript_67856:1065-1718(-)
MQSSQLFRKTPSMPVTPSAATQFCVKRKGTFSGRSNCMPLPKRQSKSTWTIRPDSTSSKMFSPCRSPKPTMYPSMHHNAWERLKVIRLANQPEGSALCANHRCSTGGCLGKICRVNVSNKSLLRSKISLISRTACCGPRHMRFQSSSMTWRMPFVPATHSMRPQFSCMMTTLKVTRCKLRRWASELCCSSWLTMPPNIIIRESFRRSPLRSTLHRKV